jgi:hypothetical protein
MKSTIFFFLLFPFLSSAQGNDSVEICERYIAIENSKVNAALFGDEEQPNEE